MKPPKDPPPDVPGFTFVKGIAAGGFADVFLYQQHNPRRQLALKVIQRAHHTADTQRHFEHEANVMAGVSEHSNIVKIYASGVASPPDARPYILMDFCPGERFDVRSRGGHLPVPVVLDTGIQIASAVETAHRADVFHRDIKPENILTTRSNKPALTDFGISTVERLGTDQGALGYTPQFAPPEVIRNPLIASTRAIDVYSLGATLYYLLEGRAPYFVHGGDNSREAIEARTLAGPPPPLQREGIPLELQHLLANAMAADPAHRPPTAFELAQALQDVQQLLHLPVTTPEVFDVTPLLEDMLPPTTPPPGDPSSPGPTSETRGPGDVAGSTPPAGATVIGAALPTSAAPPTSTSPSDNATVGGASASMDNATVAGQPRAPIAPPPAAPGTRGGTATIGEPPETSTSPPAPPPTSTPPAPAPAGPRPPGVELHPPPKDEESAPDPTPARKLPAVATLGLIVAIAVVAIAAAFGSGLLGGSDETTTTSGPTLTPTPLGNGVVSPPEDVTVSRVDGVPTVSWTPPDQDDLTGFRVQVFDPSSGALEPLVIDDGKAYVDVDAGTTSVTIPVTPDAGIGTYCAQVVTIADPAISDPAPVTPACSDAG